MDTEYPVYNAAESAQNGLQKAKSEAVKRNTNVQFVWGGGSSWQIQLPASAVIETATTEGAKGATAVATPNNATTVTFNNLGGIVDPNPNANANHTTVRLLQIIFDSANYPASSGKLAGIRKMEVTIGAGGNTRMCDPDPNLTTSDPRKC